MIATLKMYLQCKARSVATGLGLLQGVLGHLALKCGRTLSAKCRDQPGFGCAGLREAGKDDQCFLNLEHEFLKVAKVLFRAINDTIFLS